MEEAKRKRNGHSQYRLTMEVSSDRDHQSASQFPASIVKPELAGTYKRLQRCGGS